MLSFIKEKFAFLKLLKGAHSERYNAHSWIVGKPVIGEGVWIGAYTLIDGLGGLTIGRGCDISSGAHIISHSTAWRCVTERKHSAIDFAPVEIGDYCFIGENATILRGAKIGHHSIIGAGAMVKEFQEIPPYSLAVGVPARVVRNIQNEIDLKQKGQLK